MILNKLNPSLLWQYFEEICKIPRASKHEEKIISFLVDFANLHNLEYKKDAAGNLVIFKPASRSKENSSAFVLQSHVDMVCEKNGGVAHNFNTDPIQVYIDNEWVKARGTTLGADDGIGVAAMMAVLSDNTIEHGPLECLFTVDEESGLTGAFELQKGFFTGKTLLNLDSEDEGELFIGCAGGIDTTAVFTLSQKNVFETYKGYLLSVTGLTGGHSGDDIHRNRGNALKIMTSFLAHIMELSDCELHRFEGGNLKNAIPREAFASVLVPPAFEEAFLELFESFKEKTTSELSESEPAFSFIADPIPSPETKISRDLAMKLLKSMHRCPNGVISWSKDIKDLVETSTNLASIKFVENDIVITTSQRSSSEVAKKEIALEVAEIFRSQGAEIRHSAGYPGWSPNMESKILQVTAGAYQRLFNEEPKIKAIHAGLECGLFLEKYPGLDMISFGPTIKGAHSPDERLHIPSVDKFWMLLLEILKQFDYE